MAEIINETITRKVADLARLELTDAQVTQFTQQFGRIFQYIDLLSQVNVEGVTAMVSPIEMPTPLREDVAHPFATGADGKPKVLSAAPEVLYDGYKVPPIL